MSAKITLVFGHGSRCQVKIRMMVMAVTLAIHAPGVYSTRAEQKTPTHHCLQHSQLHKKKLTLQSKPPPTHSIAWISSKAHRKRPAMYMHDIGINAVGGVYIPSTRRDSDSGTILGNCEATTRHITSTHPITHEHNQTHSNISHAQCMRWA